MLIVIDIIIAVILKLSLISLSLSLSLSLSSLWPRPRSEYAGGSDRADLSGAKAPEGPAYRYDGCRGKPAGALCPERGGRTP